MTDYADRLLAIMSPLDVAALVIFLLSMTLFRFFLGRYGFRRQSLAATIQKQRLQWMENMVRRDNRAVDAILLGSLSQGNAFFASTTAIAIGGLTALIGSGDKAQAILERLPIVAKSNPVLWELKLMLIMAIFIFAFFKFAWAFRLSHYASIMLGATPLYSVETEGRCLAHAERTARLAGLSAEHSNSGLRSYYYAIAVMAWFIHPLAFIAANLWILLILIRRDFFSRSRRLIGDIAPG
ncbi:MAG TPA: DUF599 family protein [Hyphomicrobiaceae bacterium]|nr:DUF599 family protein [Hyphomicrobiaceae bacterium]